MCFYILNTKKCIGKIEFAHIGIILKYFFLSFSRVVDNGVETVKTYENDILKSHTVNGQKQAISSNEPIRNQHRLF